MSSPPSRRPREADIASVAKNPTTVEARECDRALVGQLHAIKRRVLPSGKVSFDAEGHADRFWAIALACQKERGAVVRTAEVGG